jgi:hypothetical protein
MGVFWVVAPCSMVKVYHRFKGLCCLHHQGLHHHCPDDGGRKYLWNVDKLLPDYTVLQPRRHPSSKRNLTHGKERKIICRISDLNDSDKVGIRRFLRFFLKVFWHEENFYLVFGNVQSLVAENHHWGSFWKIRVQYHCLTYGKAWHHSPVPDVFEEN